MVVYMQQHAFDLRVNSVLCSLEGDTSIRLNPSRLRTVARALTSFDDLGVAVVHKVWSNQTNKQGGEIAGSVRLDNGDNCVTRASSDC